VGGGCSENGARAGPHGGRPARRAARENAAPATKKGKEKVSKYLEFITRKNPLKKTEKVT